MTIIVCFNVWHLWRWWWWWRRRRWCDNNDSGGDDYCYTIQKDGIYTIGTYVKVRVVVYTAVCHPKVWILWFVRSMDTRTHTKQASAGEVRITQLSFVVLLSWAFYFWKHPQRFQQNQHCITSAVSMKSLRWRCSSCQGWVSWHAGQLSRLRVLKGTARLVQDFPLRSFARNWFRVNNATTDQQCIIMYP